MSADDVVIIQDDNQKDSDIEVVDISKENRTGVTIQNTNDRRNLDDDVIEIIDIDTYTVNKEIKDYLTRVCSENRIIGEFIEKCLDLENSSGMLRAIHRIFLPAYYNMEDGYRESDDFKTLIDMKMRALEVCPNRKFSHLKSVCEIMKAKDRDRKKVPFTTISSEVKAKPAKTPIKRKRRKRRSHLTAVKKSKRKSENIIVLDDELDESSAEVDLGELPNENIEASAIVNDLGETSGRVDDLGETSGRVDGLEETSAGVDDIVETRCVHGDLVIVQFGGDNPEISSNNIAPQSDEVVILDDENEVSNVSNKENNTNRQNRANLASNSVQVQANAQVNTGYSHNYYTVEVTREQQIKSIEMQIEYFKKRIDELEQEEVMIDTDNSPYVQCEKMKSQIVSRYKELCKLTGDAPIKKREVRFTATDGHPQLPVKILEKFINDNIGSDGSPNLPDFLDVVNCVTLANETGQFGWQKQRIWQEARALFTFCGQALQQNRKKREWRYMLGRLNSQIDDDPAEKDAELMARLEANRRIAVKKESDLLEQYVKMEEHRDDGSIPNNFQVDQDGSDDEFESNTMTQTIQPNNENQEHLNIVNNNVNSLTSKELNSSCASSSIGFTLENGTLNGSDKSTVNNQGHEITVRPNNFGSFATRTLEINSGYNEILEIRVVSTNGTNQIIENSSNVASSQENHLIPIEDNIQSDETVANVSNQEHVEKESRTYTRTDDIEFDRVSGINISHVSGIISSKHLESYEDTYMDFITNNSRDKSPGKLIKISRSRIHPVIKDMYLAAGKQDLTLTASNTNINKDTSALAPDNMTLLIKDVFSVANKQNDTLIGSDPIGNNIINNVCENPPLIITDVYSISAKENDTITPSYNSGNKNNIDDCSATSLMIKEVYSVATKSNDISSQVTVTDNSNHNKKKDISPTLDKNTSVVRVNNLLVTKNTLDKLPEVHLSHKDTTNKTNVSVETTSTVVNVLSVETEQRSSTITNNLETEKSGDEENLMQDIKPEVSNILREMATFGNSFTATVFDIEDPFLIIEISDTSDESDNDLD